MHFDNSKYTVWTWKNPINLHWIINPGLAFNELLLGQRVPKITLIEKDSKKPLAERSFIPCPHCDKLHSSLKWSPQNKTAFRNWFGLYCDNCGNIIPCIRNLTSLVIIGLTSPFWIWFKDKWKQNWLITQKEKFSQPLEMTLPDYNWWYIGLRFSLSMLIFTSFFNYLLLQEEFTWNRLFNSTLCWLIGGLVYGFLMKKFGINNPSKQNESKILQVK